MRGDACPGSFGPGVMRYHIGIPQLKEIDDVMLLLGYVCFMLLHAWYLTPTSHYPCCIQLPHLLAQAASSSLLSFLLLPVVFAEAKIDRGGP